MTTTNTKWIVATLLTLAIAIAGWIFGGVNAKSCVDLKLLMAQDELLYSRITAEEKLNSAQQYRIDILEQKMDSLGIKVDQILQILRGK